MSKNARRSIATLPSAKVDLTVTLAAGIQRSQRARSLNSLGIVTQRPVFTSRDASRVPSSDLEEPAGPDEVGDLRRHHAVPVGLGDVAEPWIRWFSTRDW
jgi:hypothetical protein